MSPSRPVALSGSSGISTVSDGNVALLAFPPRQFQEMACRVPLRRKDLAFDAAAFADPPPGPHDSRLAEQRRLDRQHIIARHVACGVDALTVEFERVESHVSKIVAYARPVQRLF